MEDLARGLELSFGENEVVYIGVWPTPLEEMGTGHLDGFLGVIHNLVAN